MSDVSPLPARKVTLVGSDGVSAADNAGLATSAKQDTGNTSLASIATEANRIGSASFISGTGATKALIAAGARCLQAIPQLFLGTGATPSPSYFQLFNKATAPVADDVPVLSIRIQANQALAINLMNGIPPVDLFPLGIGWAISSTPLTFTDGCSLAGEGLLASLVYQ